MEQESFYRRLLARPWVRAQLCATAMGSILLAATAAYASHRAKGVALTLGSEILTNVSPMSGAESVELNGAHFYFAVKVLNAKLGDVIDGAEAICKREGADLERDLGPSVARLPTVDLSAGLSPNDVDVSRLLTVRTDAADTGEVGCWVRRSAGPRRSILERLKGFAQSLDLSEFGSLQFVHAERHGDKTLVRVLWSDGPLSIRNFFPDSTDTPGHDLDSLPRPPGSLRIISGHVQNAGRHIVGYQSSETPEQLNAFYGEALPKLGWREIDLGEKAVGSGPLLEHAYQKETRRALLALTPGEDNTGATFVEVPQE